MVVEFIDQSVFRMKESLERIEKCLDQLSEDEVWHKPNEASNSVGNLIVHLNGNVTQYILAGMGGAKDNRNRDKEFEKTGGKDKKKLLSEFKTTMEKAFEACENMSPMDMLIQRTIQGFTLSGMGVIIHVVEHLSYHTGQIAYITKALTNQDLGFYAGQDLNVTNN